MPIPCRVATPNDKGKMESFNGRQIALHPRLSSRGDFPTVSSHYPEFKQINPTAYQQTYRDKMGKIGPKSLELFEMILDKKPRHWGDTVKGIISLTRRYSNEVVELACRRALVYGATDYQIVKRILKTGAYALPAEEMV